MNARLLLAGLLVTTVAGAQMRTPTPAELARPTGEERSPLAQLDDETAVDPQFELLRKQIGELRHAQSAQQALIVQLRGCVVELAKAAKSRHGTAQLVGSLQASEPGSLDDDDDGQGHLSTGIGQVAPTPKPPNLAKCD